MKFWLILFLLTIFFLASLIVWIKKNRPYYSVENVASSYDQWTNDRLLERLWGEHIHLGFYRKSLWRTDFRKAKEDFVHELVKWSGLDKLPKGSRVLDVGCGIGGSARILAGHYGFDVLGITVSDAQVERAKQLTPSGMQCNFERMDALDLTLSKGSFDGVWSVEAGPHIPEKQIYADEMLRVLRPGGVLVVADWNKRDDFEVNLTRLEKIVMSQLLSQWSHPEFSTIAGFQKNLLNSRFCGGAVEIEDWTQFTLPSWMDSISEGLRRPHAVLGLGPEGMIKALREVPTILLMHWAFSNGLMEFGVFRSRG